MYFRPALRISAPGSNPASVRIWKPLQMPSTGPPPANFFTACITGENRAIAPVRSNRRRQIRLNQHRVHALEVFRVVPEKGDRLVGHFGNHVVRIVVAIGAGKDNTPNFMPIGYQLLG